MHVSDPSPTTQSAFNPATLDLPRWMQRAQRGTDWGVLIVIVLCFTAAWPFLFRSEVSALNDQAVYAVRSADYALSLSEGRLYPRWSAHSAYGYGSPFPSFAPPLAAYGSALIQLAVTNDPTTAVRVMFAVSFLCAGTSVYALTQRRVGSPPAVTAAALYVLSPMLMVTTPHVIGELSWSLAFALVPLLLWSIDRLTISAGALDFALVALVQAGLILTHPAIAAAATIIGAGYFIALRRAIRGSVTGVTVGISALVTGICLSAFYWLPALGEQHDLSWLSTVPRYSFDKNDLFALTGALDPAAALAEPQITPGTALWLSALLSTLATLLHRPAPRRIDDFWLAASVVIMVLWFVIGQPPIWVAGLLSLALALASPRVFTFVIALSAQQQRLGYASALTLIIAVTVPTSLIPSPGHALEVDATQPVERVMQQVSGFGDQMASMDQPIPLSLSASVLPDTRLISAYPDRIGSVYSLDRPADTLITPLVWTGHYRRYQIQIRDRVQLMLPLAYFPGWQAELNGIPTPLTRAADTGLIVIDLPTLTVGELSIHLGPTPLRIAAWAISWFSLGIILLITSHRLRHRVQQDEEALYPQTWPLTRLLALTVALWLLFVLVAGAILNMTPLPETGLHDFTRFPASTTEGIEFLGYLLPDTINAAPGGQIPITLAWNARTQIRQDYVAHAFLLSLNDGSRWAFTAPQAPGNLPTRLWPINRYVIDRRTLILPDDLPDGEYAIGIEVFVCRPACNPALRLSFIHPSGPIGRTLVIPRTLHTHR